MEADASLAGYLDGALPEEIAAAVEEALIEDGEALRQVVAQQRIDAALRAILRHGRHEQVKRGILADLDAATIIAAKKRVLAANTAWQVRRRAQRQDRWIAVGALALATCIVLCLRFFFVSPQSMLPDVAGREPSPAPLVKEAVRPIQPSPELVPVPVPKIVATPPTPPPSGSVAGSKPPSAEKPVPATTPPPPIRPVPPTRPVVAAAPVGRDPEAWPFATHSPWNQPIGASAVYSPPRYMLRQSIDPARIGLRWRPALRENTSGQPYRLLAGGRDLGIFHLDLPKDLAANDQPLALFTHKTGVVVELRYLKFDQPQVIQAAMASETDLRGSGFTIGSGESGSSALAGVIGAEESTHGIRHALAIGVDWLWLTNRGPGYVWPATNGLVKPMKDTSRQGNVTLGTLLAIPPGVIDKLNIGAPGTVGYEIARALQDYGAYVTDSCKYQQFHFFFADATPPVSQETLARLAKKLHVITNNTPATPGGGGKPLRDYAPELSPP